MVSIDLNEKAQEWKEEGRWNPSTKEERQALQDYLNDKYTLEQAAIEFTRIVSNDPAENPDTNRVCILLELAAVEFITGESSHIHDRLIDLLKAIKGLPPLIRNGKQAVDSKGRRFWDDLPGFAQRLHEKSKFLVECIRDEYFGTEPGNHIKLLNASSFIVKVLQQELVQDKSLTKLLEHGPVFLLKEALEESRSRRTTDARLSSAQNTLVTAAARYILDAGKYVQKCDYEAFGRKPSNKSYEKSRPNIGWDLKEAREKEPISRWQFWITRFSEMYKRDDLDKSTQQLANFASQRMRSLRDVGPKVPLNSHS